MMDRGILIAVAVCVCILIASAGFQWIEHFQYDRWWKMQSELNEVQSTINKGDVAQAEKIINAHNKLIELHNALVDEHNKVFDKANELVRDYKDMQDKLNELIRKHNILSSNK
tara:strand:- start:283 stop:621 length:339 start_codon:yes stop_codon:yes gene_type:complete